jgi:uncharacterized protein (DUF1697 family)
MTYVALLRGINVGGKSIIKMAELKECLEHAGLKRVTTYIQSGNIIFETDERVASALIRKIEGALSATFRYKAAIVIRSLAQFRSVVAEAPRSWRRGTHLRRYVAFLRAPLTAKQAIREVEVRQGIDTVTAGKGVLYMSTLLSGLSKSALTKLVSKPIYQDMTTRNYATCLKILDLMEEGQCSS